MHQRRPDGNAAPEPAKQDRPDSGEPGRGAEARIRELTAELDTMRTQMTDLRLKGSDDTDSRAGVASRGGAAQCIAGGWPAGAHPGVLATDLSRGLRRHSGWQSIGTVRMNGSRLPGSEPVKPPGRGQSRTSGTTNWQTGATLLAIGIANTTRSGVGRWPRRKSRVARVRFAGLFLLALTVIAAYLGS